LTFLTISAIIGTMARNIQPNPFETSEADKAVNLARVKAERDAKDEVRGFGSDGPVVEALSDFGLKAMDVGEVATQGFVNAADDLTTLPGTLREKIDL